jgi:phosphate binding protein
MRNLFLLLLVFALPFVVVAQDATEEPMMEAMEELIELPAIDPLAVEGDIIVAGSSTVFPVTERMADLFVEEGFPSTITVDSIGSGAGFERFCVNTETDISNASRGIKDTEVEECQANDREPIEFQVGIDALAIAVSIENDFVDTLTLEELALVFSGEAATWADVNADWPAEAIQLFSPGTDSGTFDFFVEAVFDEDESLILGVEGIQLSEDDNVLVNGITGGPGNVGYFGFAYFQENQDTLRAIAVEGVEPNEETGASGEYPLSRPLFIYSDCTIMTEKPQVAEFINFYLQGVNEQLGAEADQIGYIPAPVAVQNANRQALLDCVGM